MTLQVLSKVLIVDDLADNLQALDALIRHQQRIVFHAASGEQALQLLLEHEFALAILDVQMPGMDGFELAELMRGTERTRHIPIVFTSAAGRELNYAFKGYESGAVDFLYKPLDSDAVRSKVNVFVALDQQRHEGRRQVAALEQARREQQQLVEELHITQRTAALAAHARRLHVAGGARAAHAAQHAVPRKARCGSCTCSAATSKRSGRTACRPWSRATSARSSR
jgi:CheY-like chemotaxis protein